MNSLKQNVETGEMLMQKQKIMLEGEISLMSGSVFCPVRPVWQNEPLSHGLKVIIIEKGELLCRFPGQKEQHIKGPALCAVWNQDSTEASQCFIPGASLHYTAIILSTSMLLRHLCADVIDKLSAGMHLALFATPRMQVQAVPKVFSSIQAQLFTSPLQGISRQLYLTGKALEIVAHTLDNLTLTKERGKSSMPRLTTADIARLHDVKALLAEHLNAPPSINELSVMVSMNTRKLTVGFRQLFDQSIYEYLHTLRLETAWRMLSTGEYNVSYVAYHIGYTPAHLSVAFRKKYGYAPKVLRYK